MIGPRRSAGAGANIRVTMSEHPPGWHPDPRGRHEHRYWDGTRWTGHVSDGGVTAQDELDPAVEIAAPEPVMAPTPAPEPVAASAAPPREPKGPEEALESVSDAFESTAASLAHKPASLAALLTVAAPGMGHVSLGVEGPKKTTAFILLGATIAVVVLSCFISWPLALVVYLAALAFALFDLKDELAPMRESRTSGGPLGSFADLGSALSWRLVVGGGALLALSLLLPWYRVSLGGVALTISGFDVMSLIDLVLFVIGAGAAVLGAVSLTQGTGQRPAAGQAATIVAAAASVALGLVVFRLLFVPDAGLELGIERSFGGLLAFASAVLLAGGAAGAASARG